MKMPNNRVLRGGAVVALIVAEFLAFSICFRAYTANRAEWYTTLVLPLCILAVGKGLLSSWRAERKLSGDAEADERVLLLSREMIGTVCLGLTLFVATFAALTPVR
jgi:hypothetical protein